MHSFSVNIRISQPSKVMFTEANLGFAPVNITVLGLTNPDVNFKRMHQLYNVLWYISYIANDTCMELDQTAPHGSMCFLPV